MLDTDNEASVLPEILRIVITCLQYYPEFPSGSNRLAYDEAQFLAGLGHEVWLIAQNAERTRWDFSTYCGVGVVRYPVRNRGSLDPRRIWMHQRFTREALRRFVAEEPHLVHGHSLLQYIEASRRLEGVRRTCYSVHSPASLETLATVQGERPMAQMMGRLTAVLLGIVEAKALRRSDVVTAFSSFTRSLIEKQHGAKIAKRVLVNRGWVDLDRFRVCEDRPGAKVALGWPSGVPVLFTLRRLVPRMGVDRLLLAVKEVQATGMKFHLVVGGAGPLRPTLESLANELGLSKTVSFVGRVDDSWLPTMYGAADAFVLPTTELECFGLIAIEALACGRPVLATPVGAIPEVLSHFEPKWLAVDSSAHGLATLILSFLRHELPGHSPETLRRIVGAHFEKEIALRQLTDAAIGRPSSA